MTELIYLVLVSPTKGLREVISRKPLGWSLVLIVIYTLINALVTQQIGWSISQQLGVMGARVVEAGIATSVALIIGGLVGFFLFVRLWHIIAKLLKGWGSFTGLLCGIAFASLPSILLAPVALIALYLGIAGLFILSFATAVINLWIGILIFLAMKYNYQFSTLKAIVTLILPVPVIILLTLLLTLPIALFKPYLLSALGIIAFKHGILNGGANLPGVCLP